MAQTGLFDQFGGPTLRALGIEPSSIPGGQFLFRDPGAVKKQKALQQMQAYYMDRDPQMQAARLAGLRQMLSLFAPIQQTMQSMYGSGAVSNLAPVTQNPMMAPGAPGAPKTLADLAAMPSANRPGRDSPGFPFQSINLGASVLPTGG